MTVKMVINQANTPGRVQYCTIIPTKKAQDNHQQTGLSTMSTDNRELDQRVWQAWLDKNAKQDREYLLKVKAVGAAFLVFGVALLLWRFF